MVGSFDSRVITFILVLLMTKSFGQITYSCERQGLELLAHDEVKDVEEGSSAFGYVSDIGAEEMDVQAPDVRYVETPEYSGYVFPTAVNGFRYLLSLAHPEIHHTLTDEEVALAEEILRDKLTEFCIARWGVVPDVLSDMKRFKRQYTSWKEFEGIPARGVSKGSLIVDINLVNWQGYLNKLKFEPEYFSEEPLDDHGYIDRGFVDVARVWDAWIIDWDEMFNLEIVVNLTDRSILYINHYYGAFELGLGEPG